MAVKRASKTRTLDVRPMIRRGESPCGAINRVLADLEPGQVFLLWAPFEPRPLYRVLADAGYGYESRRMADGSWRIRFFPVGRWPSGKTRCQPVCGHEEDRRKRVPLDVRRMSPAEQTAAALQAIEELTRDECLAVRSDRKPSRLLPLLGARGCAYDCTERKDHSFITMIWRQENEDASVRPAQAQTRRRSRAGR